jgi:hypothetical protein
MKKLWLFDLLIVSLGTMPEPVQCTGEALTTMSMARR